MKLTKIWRSRRKTQSFNANRLLKRLFCLALVSSCYPAVAIDTVYYQYDAMGRLVQISQTSKATNGTYSAVYKLDPAGNRVGVTTSVSTSSVASSIRNWQDFTGDGHGDLLWRSASGSLQAWLFSGSKGDQVQQNALANSSVGLDWDVIGTLDLNGDGRSDILWRSSSGSLSIWQSGAQGWAQGVWNDSSVSNDWKVVAINDFNGDGKSDILWRQNQANISLWVSNGAGFSKGVYNNNSVSSQWRVLTTGDINGDGKADLVWRNSQGVISIWWSTGAGFDPVNVYTDSTVSNEWKLVGSSDWDGDGKDDLFWRKNDGSLSVWASTGKSFVKGAYNGSADPSWVIQVLSDFNGDGKADIAFRHNTGGCEVAIWISTGSSYTGVTNLPMSCSWNTTQTPHESF